MIFVFVRQLDVKFIHLLKLPLFIPMFLSFTRDSASFRHDSWVKMISSLSVQPVLIG